MNRIILIGNGFDLAHGLETSYKNFIDGLWDKIKQGIISDWNNMFYEDDFIRSRDIHPELRNHLLKKSVGYDWFLNIPGREITYKNEFLKNISDNKVLHNWVDIEEEYYKQLKNIVCNQSKLYENKTKILKLNNDFENIKKVLEEYLTNKTVSQNTPSKTIEGYFSLFFDNFTSRDFPSSKYKFLIDYITDTLTNSKDIYYTDLRKELCKEIAKKNNDNKNVTKKQIFEYLQNNMSHYLMTLYRIYPQHTLILNFNYTKTASLYLSAYKNDQSAFYPFFKVRLIHIHGELNNKQNPIIFGYGDELADEYKEIEKLNDKDYFKNIKSIKYLQTSNYRELLNFINSDYYQIYIFGHSCGNSDRTLLNKLFENDNCVSIKPFFYEKEENGIKTNDYEDITINMSRNFNDKNKFREKVVNKTDCYPLPQIKK